MEYDYYRAPFERDGFVIVRQFLVPAELDELRSQLDRYIRDVIPGLPDRHAFYEDRSHPETLKQMQYMTDDPFFGSYIRHSQWVALAQALLGEEANSESCEWFNKPPGTSRPTPPHQDNYYFNLKPPKALTVWLALDPIDRENGCLRYVAGSHLLGLRSHAPSQILGFSQRIVDYGPEDEAREVQIHLDAGDAVAHHCELIHRADPNTSPVRSRRAFAMVFRGVSCQLDQASFERYQDQVKKQHREKGLLVSE
jgi:2-oxoglutarate-dependent dioxygenase